MKKRDLLLVLVACITFTGGFLTGAFYHSNKNQVDKNLIINKNSLSQKRLEQKQVPTVDKEEKPVLMAYIQDFRDPSKIDYSKLTHVIFSFAHPTGEGQLLMNGETAMNNLRTMVSKAHEHDTKVLLAVGGWFHISGGESYPYFKEAITNATSRKNLVNELLSLVERENLDGIDIDFEHPRSNEDAQHLAIFMRELRSQLHSRNKELSVAVNAKIHSVAGTEIHSVVYEPSMFEDVDYVNIMAYDGQWDGGYDAANLSPYPFTENIVRYWSQLFNTHGLSHEKLVLGVPFYAQPENQEIKQVSYAAIINQNSENAGRDHVEMNGTTYHYNGEMTMKKKTNLALDHGFGGMMLWEAGHDAEGTYSLIGVISKALDEKKQYAIKRDGQ